MWHGPRLSHGPVESPTSTTAPTLSPHFAPAEQQQILTQARRAIVSSFAGRGIPEPLPADWPALAAEKLGCFVTITVEGQLRGCVGHVLPQKPLYLAIPFLAIRAAREDLRFQPVESCELERLRIEISVLSPLCLLAACSSAEVLEKLQPGKQGVFLHCQGRSATYLPQVWRQLPVPADFMDSLARKAGLASHAWRGPDAQISVYEVLAFAEELGVASPSNKKAQDRPNEP